MALYLVDVEDGNANYVEASSFVMAISVFQHWWNKDVEDPLSEDGIKSVTLIDDGDVLRKQEQEAGR